MAQFRNYKFTLAANQEINPTLQGNFLRCFEGSAPFVVQPSDLNPVELQKGIGIDFGQTFNNVRIVNGATAQTIELYAGTGTVLDNRLVTSGGVNIKANTTVDYGAVTVGTVASLVLAANTARASALIANNSGAIIYVGSDNLVTTANGFPLGAGQTMTITHDNAIYAISTSSGLNVRFIEESN